MVRVGFLVEGECERVLVEHHVKPWAKENNIKIIANIEVGGSGNFKSYNFDGFLKLCYQHGPDYIIVLTDLDNECVANIKNRIDRPEIDLICVAKKSLESWYLADTEAMKCWMPTFQPMQYPELMPKNQQPWDVIAELSGQHPYRKGRDDPARVRGQMGKRKKTEFTTQMIREFNFSLVRAATHPNCASAKYFVDHLLNFKNSC